MPRLIPVKYLATLCLCSAASLWCGRACAWGDEGHEVIGLIADHYLTRAVRARVQTLLAEDDSGLVARDIAHEATWADKYRDSDRETTQARYLQTRDWHFVDLEIEAPDLNRACYGRPPLPAGIAASAGPPQDCVVDKVEQFSAQLANPRTIERQRRLALQFLLHFVGDLHQPLHTSDDHDQGGNRKIVSAPGLGTNNLHHDWDSEFIKRLGPSETAIADDLLARITDSQRRQWSRGTPDDWALESYSVAMKRVYGKLPSASGRAYYRLPESYIADATATTAEQLSKAGVRLAFILNRDLNNLAPERARAYYNDKKGEFACLLSHGLFWD